MKHLKLFEDFKLNNQDGNLITYEDIVNCIKKGGIIYSDIILKFPDNDSSQPLKPVSIDEDGLITVKYLADIYNVKLKDVKKIEI
jgi:hypothetical protein